MIEAKEIKIRCSHDEMVAISELKPGMAIESIETVKLILGGEEVLIEYRDLHWFGRFKFYPCMGGGQAKYLKANLPDKSRTIELHRLIMGSPTDFEIDHINRNGLDNRRANLRIVTHQINQNNLPKRLNASSKFHGVTRDKTRKNWAVQVCFNGNIKTIGRFESEVEAAVAYNNAVIKMGLRDVKRMNVI